MHKTFHNGTMKYLYPVILASTLLLQACAPTTTSVVSESVEAEVSDFSTNNFAKDSAIKQANILLKQGKKRDAAQAYFKAASSYPSPQKERVMLQAAEITAAMGDASLTNRYLSKIPAKALIGENGARYGYIKALLAVQLKDPNAAIKYLPATNKGVSAGLASKINQLRQSALAMGGKDNSGTAAVNVQAALVPTSVTKIGVLLPQSGSLGSVSQDIYQGMKTAKRALGKNTELTLYDVGSGGGVAQYQKAVADGADVIVGPLLSLLVYKEGKKTLKMDLSIIVLIQVLATGYGVYAIAQSRPAWIVQAGWLFEVIPANVVDTKDQKQADPDYNNNGWLQPQWVAVDDAKNLNNSLTAPQLMPSTYNDLSYAGQRLKQYAEPLSSLKQFNKASDFERVLKDYPTAQYWMPLRTTGVGLTVLLDSDYKIIKVVNLRPWQE